MNVRQSAEELAVRVIGTNGMICAGLGGSIDSSRLLPRNRLPVSGKACAAFVAGNKFSIDACATAAQALGGRAVCESRYAYSDPCWLQQCVRVATT